MDHNNTPTNATNNVVLGVDIGGTKLSAAIVDPKTGALLTETITRTHGGANFLEVLFALFEEIKQKVPAGSELTAIGIGCAGLIDTARGEIIVSNNLKTTAFPLANVVYDATALPCYVANDIEAAALGELLFGAGQDSDDFVIGFIGTGFGARMVQNGKVRRGATGTAGELGQTLVSSLSDDVNTGGPKYRPVEFYCSRPGIARLALKRARAEGDEPDTRSTLSYREMNQLLSGEACELQKALISTIADTAEMLGVKLANMVNFVNPEMIILGGGVIEQLTGYFEAVELSIRKHALELPVSKLKIVRAALGNNAGVLGAAMLPSVMSQHEPATKEETKAS
jgi:glucokinase